MRWMRALLLLATVFGAAEVAWPKDFYPLPSFSEYKVPDTQHPAPLPAWREYVDLAGFAVALVLASWLALRKRSRRGLYLLAIVSLVWFGFLREGCICAIGATQNITLACFDSTYVVPWTVVAIFTLPLLFSLFYGRTFCAAVCPLGAMQEIVAVRPVQVPRAIDQVLGLLAFVYLGLAVALAATGTAFLICRYDPFVGLFRRSASLEMLILAGCFLAVGVFIGRPYCRYLCPYGALLGLLSKLSQWHVRIPPQDCINCRLCEDVCPYGAIEEPTVAPPPAQRVHGRYRLAAMLALLPVLVALGVVAGRWLDVPLSHMHPRVRLAERIRLEDVGVSKDELTSEKYITDATENFRNSGADKNELYREAFELRKTFRIAGIWFGGWVGLVVGVKLVHLSVRRRRVDYRPNSGKCVSCGRCFWYCPEEQQRLGLITEGGLPVIDQGCETSKS